jgi:tetratricopeptide (TPR) repeat protein
VALKIVRTVADDGAQRPLRQWYAGQRAEAIAQLAAADGGRHAEDAARIAEVALAEDPGHAASLGAALAAWDDDIAAYRIAKPALERLIDENTRTGAARWSPYAVAVCELALPLLAVRPAEPVLLNYVGVALYGLNEAALALELFEAAGRLDPGVENLAGNLRAARSRLRAPARMTHTPRTLEALRRLRPALRRLASRTLAPRPRPTISLCMIVRDEEEMLPGCLESVQGHVDEMVIVDTGSSDRTVEIAESFGATVLHFAWTGSFSDARNHGLERAGGSHILWLDADERIEEGDAAALRELAAESWREAHWLVETNFTGQEEVGTAATHMALRLFRNRAQYRFSGAIHEQIRVSMPTDLPERFAPSALRIRHYGYLKSRIDARDKHARNLGLLQAELRQQPGNAFTRFNLGTEYVGLGDLARGREHFERAYELVRGEERWWELGYGPVLVARLVATRRLCGDGQGADALARELLESHYPAFTDLVFERALVARDRGDADEAKRLLERCLEMGDAPAVLAGSAGPGGFLALAALAQLAEREGRRAQAAAHLERSLAEHPGYLRAGLDLATLLLGAEDAEPQAVVDRLEALHAGTLTWHLFLGTALYERGHATLAEAQFRAALAASPQHPASRAGLVEALLTQRRYAEVEQEAGALALGTPGQVAVDRARVLAASLAHDRTSAETALAQLAASGADAGELGALRALVEAQHGESPAAGDPRTAVGLLRLLDALARLEEFEAFERLVTPFEGSVGDDRQAALALGELYLARGFYRLACDQALRALDLGAEDVRTLALLGKSAVAEGHFAEALPVLDAALELDPAQQALRTLRDQVRARVAAQPGLAA